MKELPTGQSLYCDVNIADFGKEPIWQNMLRSFAIIFILAKVGEEDTRGVFE